MIDPLTDPDFGRSLFRSRDDPDLEIVYMYPRTSKKMTVEMMGAVGPATAPTAINNFAAPPPAKP